MYKTIAHQVPQGTFACSFAHMLNGSGSLFDKATGAVRTCFAITLGIAHAFDM